MAKVVKPATEPQVSAGRWFEYDEARHGPMAPEPGREIVTAPTLKEPKNSGEVANQVVPVDEPPVAVVQ